MTRSLLLAFALPLALTLSLAAPAHASDAEGTHPAQSRADVVDIAIGSPDHTTLVSAVQAAGRTPLLLAVKRQLLGRLA